MEPIFRKFPAFLIVIFCVRSMTLGPQLVDIGILAVLGTIFCFLELKTDSKTIKTMQDRLDKLDKDREDQEKASNELKTYVSGIKMSMNNKNNSSGIKF